jgi:antitoxin component HigA of HigAB toxin-antitoxin module
MSDINRQLIAVLKHLQIKYGWSNERLALHVDSHRQDISNWYYNRKNVPLRLLIVLRKRFGLDINALIDKAS